MYIFLQLCIFCECLRLQEVDFNLYKYIVESRKKLEVKRYSFEQK